MLTGITNRLCDGGLPIRPSKFTSKARSLGKPCDTAMRSACQITWLAVGHGFAIVKTRE